MMFEKRDASQTVYRSRVLEIFANQLIERGLLDDSLAVDIQKYQQEAIRRFVQIYPETVGYL